MSKKTIRKSGTKETILNTIGWVGAAASLSAYFLVSFGILEGKELSYQVLNLIAALGLGAICYYRRTYQPFFVNIIWGMVALLAIANIFFGFYRPQ
jgi:hypothetical protein